MSHTIVVPPANPVIAAAGTREGGGALSRAGRMRRWTEMGLLFVLAPLAMRWIVHDGKIPMFAALLPVLVVALFLLLADPTFRLRTELTRRIGWRNGLSILVLLVVAGGGLTAWIESHHPAWLFEFPRNRPDTYTRIMIGYPIFSVMAQELLYRSFFFHRYGMLFGRQVWLAVAVNGLLFGFAHIVMDSAFAVAATVIGGLVLGARYAATRSFWAVFLEHTLWGWLFFTIGLGRYFFTGISNL